MDAKLKIKYKQKSTSPFANILISFEYELIMVKFSELNK